MNDEIKPSSVERAADQNVLASPSAPFLFFDTVPAFGLVNGVGALVLEALRQNAVGAHRVALDGVPVAHIRGSLQAIRLLRAACDGILLMAEPTQQGEAN